MTADDTDPTANRPSKRERKPAHKDQTPEDGVVREVNLDRLDMDWSGSLADVTGRLPLRISQAGHANDLNVQINVAMLPPVEDFRGYEAAAPGAAQHLMQAADEQRHHRFALETRLVEGSERRRFAGQIFSALLSLVGLGGAITLGLFGNPWVGGVLAVVAVGGPLAAQTLAGMLARQAPPAQPHARKDAQAVGNTDDKPQRPT